MQLPHNEIPELLLLDTFFLVAANFLQFLHEVDDLQNMQKVPFSIKDQGSSKKIPDFSKLTTYSWIFLEFGHFFLALSFE